jgi:hypothetical protein
MQHNGWDHALKVTAGGKGLVGHAGAILLRKAADQLGLTAALSAALLRKGTAPLLDRGTVLASLAVAIALGATSMSDIALLAHLAPVLGDAPSGPTVRRALDLAGAPAMLDRVARARAKARERAWKLIEATPAGFPWLAIAGKTLAGWLVIDMDATLVTACSDKEGAAPTWKKGYGFFSELIFVQLWGFYSLPLVVRAGGGASGDVPVGGHAEVGGRAAAGGERSGLGDLGVGGGEADLESFGFAGPAFAFCFGDAAGDAVAYLSEPVPLIGVDAEHRAADAAVLVDAGGAVGSAAVAECELAALEVAEELLPFGVGRGAVFGAGPQRPAAGDERAVPADDFLGIDGLVAHGRVDVAVPGDELGDVRRHAVHDRVGDQHAAEVVRGEPQRLPGGAGEAGLA